jgi:hypothetical protein
LSFITHGDGKVDVGFRDLNFHKHKKYSWIPGHGIVREL